MKRSRGKAAEVHYRRALRGIPGTGLTDTRDVYEQQHHSSRISYPDAGYEALRAEQERQDLIVGIKVGLIAILVFIGFLGYFALADYLWL